MPETKPPSEFQLERHIYYLFGQIFGFRNKALNATLRPFGIDYQRWRILAALSQQPGCSMQRLSDLTAVERTTLHHTLRLMADDGLVDRRTRESDRRSIELFLTPDGRQKFETILPVVVEQNRKSIRGFSEREFETLIGQLNRIIDNLKD